MAVSRARTALSLLAGIVAGLSAALAASRLQADATITFPLHPLNPNGAEGAGFSGALLGATSNLTIVLTTGADLPISEIWIRSSGSALWAPSTGNFPLPATSQSYSAYGIGRNDDHSVAFAGQFAPPGTGPGTPPTFDAAIADLQIANHEITQGDGNGLMAAPSMVIGPFPATLPANINPASTTFSVTPRWAGPPNPTYVGYVSFSVSAGLAVYDPTWGLFAWNDGHGTGSPQSYPVMANGMSNIMFYVVTNDSFDGNGTVTATFTWSNSISAWGSATDYVRIMAPTVTVCGVGFGGSNYNPMYKTSDLPYDSAWARFDDVGTSPIGWNSYEYVAPPYMTPQMQDPVCFSGGSTLGVEMLVNVQTPQPIPEVRVMGSFTDASGNNANVTGTVSVTDQPGGGTYTIPMTDVQSAQTGQNWLFPTQVYNGRITFNWNYDLDDRPTPNVALGTTNHQLFLTLAAPLQTISQPSRTWSNGTWGLTQVPCPTMAKRVDWATGLANGATSISAAAAQISTALWGAGSSLDYSGKDDAWNPWAILDNSEFAQNGDCITMATVASAGMDMLGAAGTPCWSWPTADASGLPGTPDTISASTCTQLTKGQVTYNGVQYPARLWYLVGTSHWNRFEGFFTVQDPGIEGYTVGPPTGPWTNPDYYYLQVLNSVAPLQQFWCADGDQNVAGVGPVGNGEQYPNIPAVPLPAAPPNP